MHIHRITLAVATTLAVTSCAAAPAAPPELIDLYDMTAPGGGIEIELERDGSFREIEADIPLSALPEHIVQAAKAALPGALLTGAEREVNARGAGWEVKLNHEGRVWELVFDEEGTLLETEHELTASEAPAAVMTAAERAVPGSTLKSVEIITKGEETEYHVKRLLAGASHKMVLAPDGAILRHVIEAKAEIEIPIR